MKILVTGGAGYLGSILCRKLLESNHSVICMDTLLYGKSPIDDLIKHDNFEAYVQKDIRDITDLARILNQDIDCCVHLAGLVGAPSSGIDPNTTIEINKLATQNIAQMCDSRDIPLIFASTCSIYGDRPNEKLTEADRAKPTEPYAIFKHESERDILQTHTGATILRFGTLFGLSPRMRFDLVINKFIAQAVNNEPITVYGGGKQMRPFLHVADASDAIQLCIEKRINGIYNVISINRSILQAAKTISELANVDLDVSEENEDNRNYSVSIEKLSNFGFSPQRTIESAYEEISNFIKTEKINFKDPVFSNYDSLLIEKISQKVFLK